MQFWPLIKVDFIHISHQNYARSVVASKIVILGFWRSFGTFQKSTESFLFFSLKNIELGNQLLLMTLFLYNYFWSTLGSAKYKYICHSQDIGNPSSDNYRNWKGKSKKTHMWLRKVNWTRLFKNKYNHHLCEDHVIWTGCRILKLVSNVDMFIYFSISWKGTNMHFTTT